MINYWSMSMLLVLLEPVNRADFKYVFAVWIGTCLYICKILRWWDFNLELAWRDVRTANPIPFNARLNFVVVQGYKQWTSEQKHKIHGCIFFKIISVIPFINQRGLGGIFSNHKLPDNQFHTFQSEKCCILPQWGSGGLPPEAEAFLKSQVARQSIWNISV